MLIHDSQFWWRGTSSSFGFFTTTDELASVLTRELKSIEAGWAVVPVRDNRLFREEALRLPAEDSVLRGLIGSPPVRVLALPVAMLQEAVQSEDPLATASLSGAVFIDCGPLTIGTLGQSTGVGPSSFGVVNGARNKITGELERNQEGPRLFALLKKGVKPLLAKKVAKKLKDGRVVVERGMLASMSAAEILGSLERDTFWRIAS